MDGDDHEGGSKKARGIDSLSPDERNRMVGEIVRYILLSEKTKTYAARADISKLVLAPHGANKMAGPLLPLAAEKLHRVFGWEMLAVPSFSAKGKFESAGTKDYTTRMTAQLEEFMAPIRDELPTPPDYTFLMIVLSIILMHNFAVEDKLIYKELNAYGIHSEHPHPAFGNMKPEDLIRDLTKQHYLSIKKVTENGYSSHFVNIGSRSLLEIGKANILRFINSICKSSTDPSALKEFMDEQASYLPHFAMGEDLPAATASNLNDNATRNGGTNGAEPAEHQPPAPQANGNQAVPASQGRAGRRSRN